MIATRLPLTDTLDNLTPDWPKDPQPAIQEALDKWQVKVVVLDDDPTGTQTVHDIPVLTTWDKETLETELLSDLPCFYILTNSRSLPPEEARKLNAEIGHNLEKAAEAAERDFVVVSRSDSTLRGHFPDEVEALAEALEEDYDGWLLIPFFEDSGRYTIDDVHYVAEGNWLVPAGETEFAKDASFGYRASNLRLWVEEKSKGRIPAREVTSISLSDIRRGGPEQVTKKLMSLLNSKVCVVNAVSRRDMEVVTAGLLAAEAQGKRFLYRTGASFVPVRAGIPPRELLQPREICSPYNIGGLIVVGSYVPRTTVQLGTLLRQKNVKPVEVNVHDLIDPEKAKHTVWDAAQEIDDALSFGRDTVVFTSRLLVTGKDEVSSLKIGNQVSKGLINIVRKITQKPRYVLAKGGITSSDIATKGLGVRRAKILGQILPGVPVWKLGRETRYPGLSYIVFPGNVGNPETLAEVQQALSF